MTRPRCTGSGFEARREGRFRFGQRAEAIRFFRHAFARERYQSEFREFRLAFFVILWHNRPVVRWITQVVQEA